MDNGEAEVIPGILTRLTSLESRQDNLEERLDDVAKSINSLPGLLYTISERSESNIKTFVSLQVGRMESQQKGLFSELRTIRDILDRQAGLGVPPEVD